MIALDLYVGENALANHLSSPKGSACTRCVQMSSTWSQMSTSRGIRAGRRHGYRCVLASARSDWNDTTRLAITERRWP